MSEGRGRWVLVIFPIAGINKSFTVCLRPFAAQGPGNKTLLHESEEAVFVLIPSG